MENPPFISIYDDFMMMLVHSTIQPPLFPGIFRLAIPGGSTMVHRYRYAEPPVPEARSAWQSRPGWVSGEKTQQFLGCFFGSTAMVPKSKGEKKLGKVSSRKKKDVRLGSMITIFAGIYLLSFLGGSRIIYIWVRRPRNLEIWSKYK